MPGPQIYSRTRRVLIPRVLIPRQIVLISPQIIILKEQLVGVDGTVNQLVEQCFSGFGGLLNKTLTEKNIY